MKEYLSPPPPSSSSSSSSEVNINTRDEFGSTALIYASKFGNVEMCSLLIEKGADVNAKDSFSHTSLLEASRGGHHDVVEILLENGADVDMRDFGETALMWASEAGYVSIVRLLIEKGSDVNARSNVGDTALISAVSHGQYNVAKILMDHGADVNAEDGQGYSALMWAVMYSNDEDMKRLMVEYTAHKGGKYESPLIIACEKCREDMIRSLLQIDSMRIDVNAQKESDGNTALMQALISCDDNKPGIFSYFYGQIFERNSTSKLERIVLLLVEARWFEITKKNKDGENALQVAERLQRSNEVLAPIKKALAVKQEKNNIARQQQCSPANNIARQQQCSPASSHFRYLGTLA